ncbi:hypothetical protein OIU77_013094 [Salix suchowensis]|uniref:ACT domain-containing protein ACR n=1 Tax=Salix suchowensis TaxID=1278906 RepID=A0ABQ8ZT94_9ROSI|nr:hypothetical protein OIU77_013094 [Salix suchowensis]
MADITRTHKLLLPSQILSVFLGISDALSFGLLYFFGFSSLVVAGNTFFFVLERKRGGSEWPCPWPFSNLAFQFSNVKVVQNPVCFGLAPTKLPFLCKERRRLSSSRTVTIPGASSAPTIEDGSQNDTDAIPTPKDRLGALLDTMNALKNLGLNVVKANVFLDSSGKHNTFSITKVSTGRKIDDPELLEAIRLTIINNLLQYHPESSSQLAMGIAFGVEPPKQVDVDIATRIKVKDDSHDRSLLFVEAADRPGLLVDLVKIITEINIAVESGEFDTEATFHVSYKGKAISKPLQLVLANSLRYFLRRPSTEDASF